MTTRAGNGVLKHGILSMTDAEKLFIHDMQNRLTTVQQSASGCDCPLCGRFGKFYVRVFNAPMARGLVWFHDLYIRNGRRPVHIGANAPAWVNRTKQVTTCKWWGLLRKAVLATGSALRAKTHGMWEPPDGLMEDFVEGSATIPHVVCTYNGVLIPLDPAKVRVRQVSIQDVLRYGGFDYTKLMNAPANVLLPDSALRKQARRELRQMLMGAQPPHC